MTGRPLIHGFTGTPIFKVWASMRGRCRDKHPHNKYIQKGIKVCVEWESFMNFYEDMGTGYKSGLTIDRINNDKGYSKENCRWVSKKEQAYNRSTNRIVNYKGKEYVLTDLASKYGINPGTLQQRLSRQGWSVKKSIETPIMSKSEVGRLSVKSPRHINNLSK